MSLPRYVAYISQVIYKSSNVWVDSHIRISRDIQILCPFYFKADHFIPAFSTCIHV